MAKDYNLTDEQILDLVRSGKTGYYKELVERYENRIAATIIGMIGNCSEVEDIGQEVFIRFYKSLQNFRGDSAVSTYLTRIAINLSLNELNRRKRRHLFFVPTNGSENHIAGHNITEYDNEHEFVKQAIQQLDQKFRSVVVLRLIDGCSTAETAKILDLPLGTVLSRLARAQEKLKIMLSPILEVKDEG